MHNTGEKFGFGLPGTEGCPCVDAVEVLSALLQIQLVSVCEPQVPSCPAPVLQETSTVELWFHIALWVPRNAVNANTPRSSPASYLEN